MGGTSTGRDPGSRTDDQTSGDATDPVPDVPAPFTLDDLLLLDSEDSGSVSIDSVTFSEDGIGVVATRGEPPRVLPWSSVVTHVVEPWSGGVIPEWWVDPELNRRMAPPGSPRPVTDPRATNRSLPHAEAGALIGIQTTTQTYRFLIADGDVREISRQVTAFAVRSQGPTGASSVTRVVRWGHDVERRRQPRPPARQLTWSKVQPYLVVALIVFLGLAVTAILLQSAGAIHLPYLGGTGSGSGGIGQVAPTGRSASAAAGAELLRTR